MGRSGKTIDLFVFGLFLYACFGCYLGSPSPGSPESSGRSLISDRVSIVRRCGNHEGGVFGNIFATTPNWGAEELAYQEIKHLSQEADVRRSIEADPGAMLS